jgi:protocatechuate 3,4-dioxygenase beta subunit
MIKNKSHRLIDRRQTLRLMGVGALAFVGWSSGRADFWTKGQNSSVKASSTPCTVRPQQTEGPYFVDEKLNRSDIRIDPITGVVKDGLPLKLIINVSRTNNGDCSPLVGAYVDVWHCDALGGYSDVRDNMSGDTRGQKYLRGYQVTDTNGTVEFQTIYPGWYSGRTVHIHFKVRLFAGSQKTYEFTSQLYFDDSITDMVHSQAPYSTKGARNTRNSRDGIFSNGGSQLMLDLTRDSQGYIGTFDVALEGITQSQTPSGPPEITSASVSGKQLIVTGVNFDSGAILFMDGQRQTKTLNDSSNPTTVLIAKKSGKSINPGQTVRLQVRNSDNSLSQEFLFTRPTQ